MSQNKQQLESLKELQSVRLSDTARTVIKNELTAYAETHRVVTTDTQPKASSASLNWLRLHPAIYAMPFAALLLLMLVQYEPAYKSMETKYIEPAATPSPRSTTENHNFYKANQMMDEQADSAAVMAVGQIDVAAQLQNIDTRITGLRTLIAKYRLNIGEATYTSSLKNLNNAAAHLSLASTEIDDAAAAELAIATELVAEVESNLSLLGTVTIDPETGAIIAIDFSNPSHR